MAIVEYLATHQELIRSTTDRKKFGRYVEWARASGGRVPITYRQRGLLPNHGRYYADHASSIQGLVAILSNTLASTYYVQYDVRNAHITLLLTLAARHGVATPTIERYVTDREQFLLEIDPNDRERAKNLMLKATYQGNLRGAPAPVLSYRAECRAFNARLVAENPHIVRGLIDAGADQFGWNFNATVAAAVLQQLECDVLLAAVAFLRARHWEVGALKHDGFLVHRGADGSEPEPALIAEMEAHANAACSVSGIVFVRKPLEPTIALPPLNTN